MERGHLQRLSLTTFRRIGRVLEIETPFAPRWRGGELARLLDRDHAALVEQMVVELRSYGWETVPEVTFNRFGERGSVDVVGWRAQQRALVLIEVKSRLVDVQDLLGSSDRKARIVPAELAADRGWRAAQVGRLLVVAETNANRTAVARHAATIRSMFPGRSVEARRWMANPAGPLGAIRFLRPMDTSLGMRGRGGPTRIRRPQDERAHLPGDRD